MSVRICVCMYIYIYLSFVYGPTFMHVDNMRCTNTNNKHNANAQARKCSIERRSDVQSFAPFAIISSSSRIHGDCINTYFV